ncbi:MRP51 [Candida pseudojiufengensis]|uniref:MRP51 n=1 Tax=Candida pseudojiufengensis TaxID=497109 RepID=UPI0022246CA7|nr:MRP51 [Candida pseudojiufengensis]KAI5958998.1 MRP51 [Candida pseudojiufengensis]
MSAASRELFDLVKNSRLAQVAKPHSKNIRGQSNIPTHQTIFTPSSSAYRSNYGLKTALPTKIGKSHISFNDIDNYKGMPDVEKNSGHHYTQLIFKEVGIPLKNHFSQSNPLFPSNSNKSNKPTREGSLTNLLNLDTRIKTEEVLKILSKNKNLYSNFKSFLAKNHPQFLLSFNSSNSISNSTSSNNNELISIIKDFLKSSNEVTKKESTIYNNSRENLENIQGTGGFSYNQKGRLQNTPNGVKYNHIVPGRIVGTKEAAIGGFVSNVIDRSIALQTNYARNYPGKHPRQFIMPFKISEAELSEDGSIRIFAEGIKNGTWSETDDRYTNGSIRSNFGSTSERNKADDESLESLLNLILPSR